MYLLHRCVLCSISEVSFCSFCSAARVAIKEFADGNIRYDSNVVLVRSPCLIRSNQTNTQSICTRPYVKPYYDYFAG